MVALEYLKKLLQKNPASLSLLTLSTLIVCQLASLSSAAEADVSAIITQCPNIRPRFPERPK